LDKLDVFNEFSNEVLYFFKKKYNLYHLKEKLIQTLNIMDKDDYKKLNKKLYITYFDIDKKKQIIVKKYKSNNDVIETIIKSSYIPFLMGTNITCDGKIDGGYPYIFKKKSNIKILYINLLSLNHIKDVFWIKDKNSSYIRILKGILDIHIFFKKHKNTCLCSYVENWGICDYISFRSKEYIIFMTLFIIELFDKIHKIIPDNIKESNYYLWFKRITFNLYKDIFNKIMN